MAGDADSDGGGVIGGVAEGGRSSALDTGSQRLSAIMSSPWLYTAAFRPNGAAPGRGGAAQRELQLQLHGHAARGGGVAAFLGRHGR